MVELVPSLIMTGGNPKHALEMAIEVALIAKASISSNLGDRLLLGKQVLGTQQPQVGEIGMGRQPKLMPKCPQNLKG